MKKFINEKMKLNKKDILTKIKARKIKKDQDKNRHLFGEKFDLFEK